MRYLDEPAYTAFESPTGVIRRYTRERHLIGITIVDFAHRMMGGDFILGKPEIVDALQKLQKIGDLNVKVVE